MVTAVADYMLVPAKKIKELTFGRSALQSEHDRTGRRQEKPSSGTTTQNLIPGYRSLRTRAAATTKPTQCSSGSAGTKFPHSGSFESRNFIAPGVFQSGWTLSSYRPCFKFSKFESSAIPIMRCFMPQKPQRNWESWFSPRAFFPTLTSVACSYSRQVRTHKFACRCWALWETNRAPRNRSPGPFDRSRGDRPLPQTEGKRPGVNRPNT